MNKNIIFIGFSGVGKTRTARLLAKKLDTLFLDTDDMIETCENSIIKDIFATKGEDYFRSLENKIAKHIKNNIQRTIIATGGGFPIFYKNIQKLGTVIYLQASFDDIFNSLDNKSKEKRVIFDDINKAKELYNNRKTVYEQNADYTIQASLSLEENIENILRGPLKGTSINEK